jgi:hypothetical protein
MEDIKFAFSLEPRAVAWTDIDYPGIIFINLDFWRHATKRERATIIDKLENILSHEQIHDTIRSVGVWDSKHGLDWIGTDVRYFTHTGLDEHNIKILITRNQLRLR